MSESSQQPSLTEKLAEARAMLRSDVTVSRHIFQGEPSYMLHDPVSFQNHRLSLQDYKIVAALDDAFTLQECFNKLQHSDGLKPEDEELYYRFILRLQSLGVLSLPSNNGTELYQRFRNMQKMKIRSLPMQLLFLRVPLARPDAFLERTAPLVRWMFTRAFVPVWLVMMLICVAIVFTRRDEFFQPLNGLLTASNFLTLSAVLLVLKVWHELGHGYACRIFGGRVPEMGMMLMMGAPLAYMDASAAWTFPHRRHRLVVMLGGMYFESLAAIPAVFIWAIAGPSSLLGSIAYQVVFMATAITVLFNANPLMKYDGYFILSDLLGIPNFKQRSTNEFNTLFKRNVLGLKTIPRSTSKGKTQAVLLTYAIASSVYRVGIVLSLATVLASHAFLLGIAMGVFFVVSSISGSLGKFLKYLWFADETASVRSRAVAFSAVPLLLLPLAMFTLPAPGGILAVGVVGAENEHILRASVPGFVKHVSSRPGITISQGDTLLELSNAEINLQHNVQLAELKRKKMEMQLAGRTDLAAMASLKHEVHSLKHTLESTRKDLANLVVHSPAKGSVVSVFNNRDQGSYVQIGDPLATIVAGKTIVKAWLTGDQMRTISPEIGDAVSVRFPGARLGTQVGKIRSIAPAAVLLLEDMAATHVAGGDIPVNPATGETLEPLVQITVQLPDRVQAVVAHNSQASVNFKRAYEPIAFYLTRRLMVFLQKLSMS